MFVLTEQCITIVLRGVFSSGPLSCSRSVSHFRVLFDDCNPMDFVLYERYFRINIKRTINDKDLPRGEMKCTGPDVYKRQVRAYRFIVCSILH